MYCFIPKVACSTFKTLMMSSAARLPVTKIVAKYKTGRIHHAWKWNNVRVLPSYNETGRSHRLNTYFKFMAVRHPFDRLLSAWIDKIEFTNRESPVSLSNLTEEHYSRFHQFVSDVASGRMSDHWEPQSYQCDPCRWEYDSIVKLETANEDFPLILSKLNAPNGEPNSIPTLNIKSPVSPSEKLSILTKFYAGVNASVIESLLHIYRNDFSLFGYTWDVATAVAGCGYQGLPNDIDTEGCC